ncbi:NAD(P)H-hydrate dehydratase [Methylomarinum sp. Ch1-1]|uniref:Bifunctional NAD(P)H-hydrate repair enzyme n=1 Tax=Methylomarinum roseum TaxID=3067653 RepID=A0AAU7NSL9_9GAMM
MQALPENLYTAAQVREMDRIAIEEKGIPGIGLMAKAAGAVFEQIRLRWPELNKLVVFCGGGNNGGDGYVLARLALAAGCQIELVSLTGIDKLRGDALTACRDYLQNGGPIDSLRAQTLAEPCVVVDALLGTGLDREVVGAFAEAIQAINACDWPVIAVDIPSGLNADSGQVMGCAVKADCTVSFIALKRGLFTGEANEYRGELVYSSLLVPADVAATQAHAAKLIRKPVLPRRNRCAHKGHYGHVLLVGGDCGYSGAIRMAAEAALRSGAGLVSVATRADHSHAINIGRPEIMSHAVETVEQLNALLDKANVVVIGPGLGQSSWAQALFSRAMAEDVLCVADADALNLLAKQPALKHNRVITPHPGEASRLLGCSSAEIAADRFAAVTELQRRYGGVALLKGAGTLVKDSQDIYLSTTGNPGMASGGMGDVLSGLIGGLLAQGMAMAMATRLAVHAHGQAADIAAANGGERGLLASDLLAHIRTVLN